MFRKINTFLFMTSMILRSPFQLFVVSVKNLLHLTVLNISKQYCYHKKYFCCVSKTIFQNKNVNTNLPVVFKLEKWQINQTYSENWIIYVSWSLKSTVDITMYKVLCRKNATTVNYNYIELKTNWMVW